MKQTARQRSVRVFLITAFILTIASMASGQIEATIEKVWIERNVKVKGGSGMRIHAEFLIKKALNVECSIQVYVERADGLSMTPGPGTYATRSNKSVYVLRTFTPPYDRATYPDTRLFVPYSSLGLRAANLNKMIVTVKLVGEGKVLATSKINIQHGLGEAL